MISVFQQLRPGILVDCEIMSDVPCKISKLHLIDLKMLKHSISSDGILKGIKAYFLLCRYQRCDEQMSSYDR